MDIKFEKMGMVYQKDVMKIFNHYVENGTSAFPQDVVPEQFYEMLRKKSEGLSAYVLVDMNNDLVIGFCFLSPYSPLSTFISTSTISYFIDEKYVGKGLGTQCLLKLESDAAALGIHNLIAEISSENERSIKFHEKHGFQMVGKLNDIGEKLNKTFSVIYMQKIM